MWADLGEKSMIGDVQATMIILCSWLGTIVLVIIFIIGVLVTIATELAQRKFANSAYAKHSKAAAVSFIMLAVSAAFVLFR